MFAANRDSSVYDDPEVFRPSRWASTADSSSPKKFDKRHLAFAWGRDRPCMGLHMSVVLIKTLLVELIGSYRWTLKPGQDLTLKYLPVVRPLSNLVVTFSKEQAMQ